MKKNLFVRSFVIIALLLGAALVIVALLNSTSEGETQQSVLSDEVERVENLLRNGMFEKKLEGSWEIPEGIEAISYGYDNIVKREGDFSFGAVSSSSTNFFLSQKIDNIPPDNKIIFFGFIKTENCDSARLEILTYSENDSLLFTAYSVSAKGTTDWTEHNTWIRTQANEIAYLIIRGVLYGKGRIWFDNFRLYSVPIRSSFFNIDL